MTASFIGNQSTRQRLRSLVEEARLHPCLLFEGPAGVGKATTAAWLARLANCDHDDLEQRPCEECWSCRQIPKGQHPDIMMVGLDPSKTAAIISVDQSREIISRLMVKPFHARRRFVIFDPADAMTPEAANAMLKTFEDPPESTHFFLVTSAPAALPLTVRSRSQRIRFSPVSTEAIAGWLADQGRSDGERLAQIAEGCPGRALSNELGAGQGMMGARDALLAALEGDVADRFKFSETLCRGDRSKWTVAVGHTLDAIACLLRDATAVRAGGQVFYNSDRPTVVSVWADRLDPGAVAALVEALSTARERLSRFVGGRLVLDALLASLVRHLSAGAQHEAL
jgi:DNA polymerase III delta' subunit